jgi:hypothetical protein
VSFPGVEPGKILIFAGYLLDLGLLPLENINMELGHTLIALIHLAGFV